MRGYYKLSLSIYIAVHLLSFLCSSSLGAAGLGDNAEGTPSTPEFKSLPELLCPLVVLMSTELTLLSTLLLPLSVTVVLDEEAPESILMDNGAFIGLLAEVSESERQLAKRWFDEVQERNKGWESVAVKGFVGALGGNPIPGQTFLNF